MEILLIPGFMNDKALWDKVKEPLQRIGNLTFADAGQAGDIEEIAEKVLQSAPPRFAAVGFSMGGYVARALCRMAPHRVERLVLIATSARADTDMQVKQKSAAIEQVRQFGFRGLSRRTVEGSLSSRNAADANLVDHVVRMSQRLGEAAFLRQAGSRRESDLDRLAEVQCPTLIVASRNDPLRSFDEAEELHRMIPRAQLAVIEGQGHMVPLEAPNELSELIVRWLTREVVPPGDTAWRVC